MLRFDKGPEVRLGLKVVQSSSKALTIGGPKKEKSSQKGTLLLYQKYINSLLGSGVVSILIYIGHSNSYPKETTKHSVFKSYIGRDNAKHNSLVLSHVIICIKLYIIYI